MWLSHRLHLFPGSLDPSQLPPPHPGSFPAFRTTSHLSEPAPQPAVYRPFALLAPHPVSRDTWWVFWEAKQPQGALVPHRWMVPPRPEGALGL